MPHQLTWADLIIDDLPPEAPAWLGEWNWLIRGQVAPLFLSKFGDWYLRRRNGSTEVLDVLTGTVCLVAQSPEEFQARVNDPLWQEERLLSLLVYQLHDLGKVPTAGQCYGVAPHPAFGGKLVPESVLLMDIPVWQSICSQIFRPGTPQLAETGPRRNT